MRRKPVKWGEDRPAGLCKVFSLDPQGNIQEQIDKALWKFGENHAIAIWLPDNLRGKVEAKVAGLPVYYTSYIRGGCWGVWIELGEV